MKWMGEHSEVRAAESDTELKSPYFESAMYTVRREIPEKENEIAPVLESIDNQMAENLDVFESQKFPGVVVPYSQVSVNEVTAQQFGKYQMDHLAKDYRKEIVFCGFAQPPGGHPYTAGDIVYDRVIGAIPEVVGPVRRNLAKSESEAEQGKEEIPAVDVISLGSPNGLGGKITEEWVEGLKKRGFDQYAELYEEMVKSITKPADSKMIFNGMSMGATVAEKTARNLAEWKSIKVIMDNPVTNHGSVGRVLKALQIPVGFMGEGGVKMAINKNFKIEMAAEQQFGYEYRKALTEKGILVTDNGEQTSLKGTAVRTDILMMIKGSPMDKDEVRTYIRRGVSDPTTISPINLARVFTRSLRSNGIIQDTKAEGVKEYAVASTHFINRLRVEKWARIVDMAKDIYKPFKETVGIEALASLGEDNGK